MQVYTAELKSYMAEEQCFILSFTSRSPETLHLFHQLRNDAFLFFSTSEFFVCLLIYLTGVIDLKFALISHVYLGICAFCIILLLPWFHFPSPLVGSLGYPKALFWNHFSLLLACSSAHPQALYDHG